MPGKVKVKIHAGRNLPVMDRSSDTTDAYVEIKLANTTYKTDVCRKTLNPKWNTDWYRFEVDDSELQDEPLQIRLMDYDTYSANDSIGKVYLDLNPLLINGSPISMKKPCSGDSGPVSNTGLKGSSMSGWIPVYDTMHGIRGEVNVTVKVELFSDFNKFRQSSCGVQFFCSGTIPHGYHAQVIHGFVEELVVNDDPEYQWIDKIRTPRASNEARQILFLKLSGELQRKIGLKALDLGGNAVIGYKQCFDLEGDSGIVVRGIGTAVTLIKFLDNSQNTDSTDDGPRAKSTNSLELEPLSIVLTVGPQSPRSLSLYPPLIGNRFPQMKPGKGSSAKIWPPELALTSHFASNFPPRGAATETTEDTLELVSSATRRSTQSLNESPSSRRFSKGITRLLSSNKRLSVGLNTIKAKTSIESRNLGSLEDIRLKNRRVHARSSSDTVTSMLIKSLMESSFALDRVVEVKESPTSSASASRRESFISPLPPPILQLTHSDSSIPDEAIQADDLSESLRYLESNTSSGVTSSNESSTSEDESESESEPTSKDKSYKSPSSSPIIKKEDINPFIFPREISPLSVVLENLNSDNESPTTHPRKSVFALKNDFLHGEQPSSVIIIGTSNASHLLVPSPVHKSRSANSLLPTSPQHDHLTVTDRLNSSDVKHALPCLLSPHDRPSCEDVAQPPLPGSPATAAAAATGAIPRVSPSPAKLSTVHRRSSDSDLSITPKAFFWVFHQTRRLSLPVGISRKRNSLTGSDRSSHLRPSNIVRPTMNQENLEMLEYPFLTMSKYPPGFILHIGGGVRAMSVKLLERITNLDEPESRDAWWTEIRMEIRSHARAMGCNVVLGYSEQTSICDDVCVLSAAGTAAVICLKYISAPPDPEGTASATTNLQSAAPPPLLIERHPRPNPTQFNKELMTTSLDRNELEQGRKETDEPHHPGPGRTRHHSESHEDVPPKRHVLPCSVCHIPYDKSKCPFQIQLYKCGICGRGTVPEVVFTSIEVPDGLTTTGHGSLIQAFVCRPKKDCRGELHAKEISDSLPFLEYEIHRLLLNKLKVKSMNSIFGLKLQITIGEKMIIAVATGTAVFLNAMPMPPSPLLTAGNSWTDEKKLAEIQKLLQETVKTNRETLLAPKFHQQDTETQEIPLQSDTEDSEEEGTQPSDLDLAFGNKESYIFEVDDTEDADVASQLIGPPPPEGFIICNTDNVPGLEDLDVIKNIQMFTQVWRAKVPSGLSSIGVGNYLNHLLQSLYFKLRRMTPCAVANIRFRLELPEQDEMQISILGMALGLSDADWSSGKTKRKKLLVSSSKEPIRKGVGDDNDLIFNLEEVQSEQNPTASSTIPSNSTTPLQTSTTHSARPKSPMRFRNHLQRHHHTPPRDRYGVDITPLSYIPGGKIERYHGNLNFFFIRESTSIREGGGLSGFVHSFVTEVLAIVRANVTALGGNAMVSYFISECILYHNPHKNQGQCLINVGGDVVHVTYFPDD